MAKTKRRGRIIRILDPKSVVINLGREDGIDHSSLFYILGEPEHVIDPETNKSLGTVNVSKGRVHASQVFDKFTIAATQWVNYRAPNIFDLGVLTGSQPVTIDEGDLRVNKDDIQPWKAKSEIPVKIGDEVEVEVEVETQKKTKQIEKPNSSEAK